MAKFTDGSGHSWKVRLLPPAITRVRADLGIDLRALAVGLDWDRLGEILADAETVVDILHAICRPQAERRGMGPEDFGRAMVDPEPNAIMRGAYALSLEIAELMPDARARSAFRQSITRFRSLETRGLIDGG